MELGERVPLWARIAPGLAGALIILWLTGLLHPPNPGLKAMVYAASASLAGAGVFLAAYRRRRVPREHGDECVVYSVRVRDPSGIPAFNRLVGERAKRGYASYLLLSYYNRDGSVSSTLLVCGGARLLERETEIFETLVASISEGARVERRGVIDASLVLDLASGAPNSGVLVNPITMPPSRGRRYGGLVYLGDNLDTPMPEPVYLERADLEGHVGVYGSTGSGKSTTLRVIASQASGLGWSVLLVDWTGEHSGVLPQAAAAPGRGGVPVPLGELLESREGRLMLAEILSHSLGLTDPQAYMLSRVLERAPSTLGEIVELVESWPEESKWDREVKRGLRRKLEALTVAGDAFEGSLQLGEGLVVVDASRIRSPRARAAYVLSLLSYIYFTAPARRGRVLVVVDEAHNLFLGESRIFEEILAEARKHGVSIVYATQSPSSVPDRVFLNTNTKIVHALRGQRDKMVIQSTMGLDEYRLHLLDKLDRGEALVQAPSIPEPVLVKVKAHAPPGDGLNQSRVPSYPVDPDTGIPRL